MEKGKRFEIKIEETEKLMNEISAYATVCEMILYAYRTKKADISKRTVKNSVKITYNRIRSLLKEVLDIWQDKYQYQTRSSRR